MNDFSEKYKNFSNLQLLEIIENAVDYQTVAVEAAKAILAERNLSASELEVVKIGFTAKRQEKEAEDQKKKMFENKVKNFGSSVVDFIHPIQKKERTTNQTILAISIIFAVYTAWEYYKNISAISYIFTDDTTVFWNLNMLVFTVPFIIILVGLPLMTFLFWRRLKAGWIILALYLGAGFTMAVISFIVQLSLFRSVSSIEFNPFPFGVIVFSIAPLVFSGGVLLVICKENIRTVYTISKQTMFVTIGISALLSALVMSVIFFIRITR